jgi:hypothetical protein
MIYESEIECNAVLKENEVCKKYETATVVDEDCSKCVNGVQPISVLPTGNYIWMVEPTISSSFWEWLASFFSRFWEWLTNN